MLLYYPTHLNIETSDACNRRCPFCRGQQQRRPGPPRFLDVEVFRRLLVELRGAPWPLKIALQWNDEPLCNPDYFDYAELCRELLPDVQLLTQTNGDALDAASFEQLTRLFDAVAINFYSAASARHFERLGLPFRRTADPEQVVMPGRARPADDADDGAAPAAGALVQLNRKYGRRGWIERFAAGQVEPDVLCTRLWQQAVVTVDGDVHICCRDDLRQHPAGNLQRSSLVECFNSSAAMRLRALMQEGRRDRIAMCWHCPHHFAGPFDVLPQGQAKRLLMTTSPLGRSFTRIAPGQLPWGRYDDATAQMMAAGLGHLALPGFFAQQVRMVVGLDRQLAEHIVGTCCRVLGDALTALWITGSRVMTREQLLQADPAVFADAGSGGTLDVGGRARLRVFGPDVRLSSDLDLKVLVDEQRVGAARARQLAPRLGRLLEAGSRFIPISGHRVPRMRIIRVPHSCTDARLALLHYNQSRRMAMRKGPHSLEAVVLLYERGAVTSSRR